MIRKIAWDAFKNTGDIKAYLELKQIENIEDNIIKTKELEKNGEYKNKWNNIV